MKFFIAAALSLSCAAAEPPIKDQGAPAQTVVYMRGGGAWFSGNLLNAARGEASRLFLKEGIRLEWRDGKPPKDAAELPGADNIIAISFHVSTTMQFDLPDKVNALAVAQPYGKGPLPITVFGDRVASFLFTYREYGAGKVLGHILAHEIGHILQRIARHSDTGLMKARWNRFDLDDIRGGGLAFAKEDQDLLRQRFAPNGGTEAP
jgi:hypothetical protein